MKKHFGGRPLLFGGTLVLSVVCFALRRLQLSRGYDVSGLPVSGSVWTILLCTLSALGVLALLFVCGGLAKRESFARCFPPCRVCFLVSAAAAAALLVGSGVDVVAAIPAPGGALDVLAILPGFFGILAALCVFLAAVGRMKGARPLSALYLIPFFFLAVRLIVDFKGVWSSDPAILDYCFDLFAMLAAMTATYHLAGFCYDRGRRARTTFWCLTGALFSVLSLADGGLSACLRYGSLALWLLVNAWQLLAPAAPRRAPADPPSET